jgi:hypothetical protein
MKKLLIAAAATTLVAACAQTAEEAPVSPPPPSMSFFITGSPAPGGANLGGLEGADAMCQSLAASVGAGDRLWRAYLSAEATDTSGPVNARDRIGQGPWYNANGVMVAANLAQLHDAAANNLNKETSLTETGAVVNGVGDQPNQHDILTGSFADGTLYIEKDILSTTCRNWTAGDAEGVVARVGHHDRQGGGPDPTSWNSSHNTRGCALETLRSTGGDGRFMCFAAD